jgi:hypothetical protein
MHALFEREYAAAGPRGFDRQERRTLMYIGGGLGLVLLIVVIVMLLS